ncbi:MAG: hypothetical protein AB3X44_07080 [Leptothrix sp. (in: b-proteobacteria)]
MSRPRGTFGAVAQALLAAAGQQPGTVRELAMRAQVGHAAARYTACRLLEQGALKPQSDTRPHVLAVPDADADAALTDLQSCLSSWVRPAEQAAQGGAVTSQPATYHRTSETAQALGLTVEPTEVEGRPAFLLGCDGQPRQLLPDLASVHAALDRTDTTAPLPVSPAAGDQP